MRVEIFVVVVEIDLIVYNSVEYCSGSVCCT